jgi:sulfite reductase beta subunit-like hemoprotein
MRALAELADEFSEEREARTTVDQNLLLRYVRRAQLPWLHAALDEAGLALPGAGMPGDVTSCPGASSCRLAVTASRGMASELTRALEERPEVAARGEGLSIKISGCPNGCGQHYVAGIGLQGSVRKVSGRALPQYHLYVGGGFGAEQASFGRLIARIPARRVSQAVERLIDLYTRERAANESPEQFLQRAPEPQLIALLADLQRLEPADARGEDFIDLGEQQAFAVHTSEGECAS